MSQITSLAPAIEISQQILSAIDDSNLEQVTSLEVERKRLIDEYFSLPVAHIDEQQTRQLKQLNDDIVTRLRVLQAQVRTEHANLSKGSRMSKAYLNNSRS
jgi:hypothetical protein